MLNPILSKVSSHPSSRGPQETNQIECSWERPKMEILTVDELADLLKMSKRQVYTRGQTRTRSGSMKDHPLPVLKINGNLRFRKADVDLWLAKLANNAV